MSSIFDFDIVAFFTLGTISFQQVFDLFALIMGTILGSIIRGGLFTSNSTLTQSDKRNFDQSSGIYLYQFEFEDNEATLCVQYLESVVLDSSVIIYENAVIQPST